MSGGVHGSTIKISPATCRTTEPTKILAVPVELWQKWFDSSPELSAWLSLILSEKICILHSGQFLLNYLDKN